MRIFSLCEIVKHQSENDCWIIANNYVYDVTNFLDRHPGGKNAILYKSGQDVTFDYNFHSNKEIWKKYSIGKIGNCECCNPKKENIFDFFKNFIKN